MADSSADEESVSEYHSASDGGMSDFSVVEDSPFVPRPKGRPRGSGKGDAFLISRRVCGPAT